MKKLLFILMLLVSVSSSCFAYGTSYDLGYQIGTAISNNMANAAIQNGRIKRDCLIEKDYDFSKSKSFVVATILNSYDIDDVSIQEGASNMVANLLRDEFVIYPQPYVISVYMENSPNAKKLTGEALTADIFGFVQKICDTMIFVKVNNYTERGGYANVDVEITVFPHNRSTPIMTYTESRYDVQSHNKQVTMLNIIKKFRSKFRKTFKESMIEKETN